MNTGESFNHISALLKRDRERSNLSLRQVAFEISHSVRKPSLPISDQFNRSLTTDGMVSMIRRAEETGKISNDLRLLLSNIYKVSLDRYMPVEELSSRIASSIHMEDYKCDLFSNPAHSGKDHLTSPHAISLYYFFINRSEGTLHIFKKQEENLISVFLTAIHSLIEKEKYPIEHLTLDLFYELACKIEAPSNQAADPIYVGKFPDEYYNGLKSRLQLFRIFKANYRWREINDLRMSAMLNPVSYYMLTFISSQEVAAFWSFGRNSHEFGKFEHDDSTLIKRRFNKMKSLSAGYKKFTIQSKDRLVIKARELGIIFE